MAKLPLSFFAALVLMTPLAHAQTENQAAAEALFDEARRLVKAGDYAAACPKFAESQRLDAGVGTLLNLADCYEKIGKTASAWAAFREAASSARNAGQAERTRVAEERAAALEGHLSRLVVRFGPSPNLVVRRDGVTISIASSGVAFPIDPGAHEVSVEATGKKRWSTRVEVKGPGETTIDVPELEPETTTISTSPVSSSIPAAPSGSVAPKASAPPVPVTPTGRSSDPFRTAGLVGMGLGAVSLGVGAVFGARAWSTYADRKEHCSGNLCDAQGIDLTGKARSQANLSTLLLGAGVVLGGTGAALWWWGKPGRETSISPIASPSVAGFSMQGVL